MKDPYKFDQGIDEFKHKLQLLQNEYNVSIIPESNPEQEPGVCFFDNANMQCFWYDEEGGDVL